MTQEVPFTKRVCKSGRGYLLWIPKDVVSFLSLNDKSIVEVRIKKLIKNKKWIILKKEV